MIFNILREQLYEEISKQNNKPKYNKTSQYKTMKRTQWRVITWLTGNSSNYHDSDWFIQCSQLADWKLQYLSLQGLLYRMSFILLSFSNIMQVVIEIIKDNQIFVFL